MNIYDVIMYWILSSQLNRIVLVVVLRVRIFISSRIIYTWNILSLNISYMESIILTHLRNEKLSEVKTF